MSVLILPVCYVLVGGQNCFFEVRTISQDCGFSSTAVMTSVVLSGKVRIIVSVH